MPDVDHQAQSTADSSRGPAITVFEQKQIRVKWFSAWLTAGSILVSVVAALLTYATAMRTENEQAAVAFQLKVAEIVMAARTPWEAKGRAKALAAFFPDRVPASMAEEFDPETQGWGRESRRELLALLTTPPTSPDHRAVVLKTWKALFPGDKWVNDIPADR
jgi:hypothetical protein